MLWLVQRRPQRMLQESAEPLWALLRVGVGGFHFRVYYYSEHMFTQLV